MTGSQAVKGGTHGAYGGTHVRQVFMADGLPADSSGGRSMTFGRPDTRMPENTSKLEVGATIVVWVVIAVSLWGLSFGWPSTGTTSAWTRRRR